MDFPIKSKSRELRAGFIEDCKNVDKIYPKNAGIITPRMKRLPKRARGIIKLDTGTYLVYSGGWVKLSNSAPGLIRPLDKLCNRQMDVTTLTSNEEYVKEKIKNKKLVLK